MLASILSQEEELHWLALRLVPGLGSRKAGQLIERFRTPVAVFRAPRSELEAAGVAGGIAQSIASGCSFEDAVVQREKMLETAAGVVTISDPRYPPKLREIFDPPVVLFARGRVELLVSMMFGVVGTRRPTPYGMAVAERLAADLARAGLTIVSGMARGIDTAAHKGALSAAGDTVAVLGCGVDVVYPSENRKLASELAEKGLLLSEFPMGSPAYPQNFPDPQPDHQRHEYGGAGRRRRAVQRLVDHGEAGDGPGPRGFRRAGQHHLQDELGAEPPDQARR